MSDSEKKQSELEAKLREALGFNPPTAKEAEALMRKAKGIPMTRAVVQRIVDQAVRGEMPEPSLAPDYVWLDDVPTAEASEFFFNRNRAGTTKDVPPERWEEVRRRCERAETAAQDIVVNMGLSPPIDPFAIAESETPILHVQAKDFGNRFDGQLEFDKVSREFVMLVNSKYDATWTQKGHHPRTRFSVAHELGHYFLDHHRARLIRGGHPHPSHSDFTSELMCEREADHFASALLMPLSQLKDRAKRFSPGLPAMRGIADHFGTSLTSAAIRYVSANLAPVVVLKWNPDGFGWKWLSDAAYAAGIRKTIEQTNLVPRDSATGRVLAGEAGVGQPIEQGTTAAAWFPFIQHGSTRNDILTEQAISLGEHGSLTVLFPQGGRFSTAREW